MEPIAIVGFAFRLPQNTDDESKLWEVQQTRRNLATEWPKERIQVDALYDGGPARISRLPTRVAHFVDHDASSFDAPFFSIPPSEAAAMDPQQRWALEAAYHAFENAGITVQSLKGSQTAVYGATLADDFQTISVKDVHNIPRTTATGSTRCILPNRISWHFHLLGPSILVDTACSGSMVALDLACQALRNGDATAALVFGSSVLLTPETSVSLGNMGFLGPDGVCYSFDHRANGYGRGEGILAVVVKPLSRAVRDGDVIRAVVRSTGSNQDGHTPTITQPSPDAQERLIRHVYQKAGLDLGVTGYVEAHGTGTPTGDPIEIQAIGNVFGEYHSVEKPLHVGSIKANIGHLEGGSGLAGIVKSILVLEKGIIPPQALLEKINPSINHERHNITIPVEETVWPSKGVRRISVNSFGIGGTNAHAVLDDACSYLHENGLYGKHHCRVSINGQARAQAYDNGQQDVVCPAKLLVLSSSHEEAMKETMSRYEAYCKKSDVDDPKRIDQLAFTLATRRSHLGWRTFALVEPRPTTMSVKRLDFLKPVRSQSRAASAFVFTGQGARYTESCLELLRYPIFQEVLKEMDGCFAKFGCTWSLFEELSNNDHMLLPEYSQPISTAIQVALVDMLRYMGVVPVVVMGHSSGEAAAAYAAGALSRYSAAAVSYYRGQLCGWLKDNSEAAGAMMVVNLAEDEVPAYLQAAAAGASVDTTTAHIACVNSPSNCTLSGDESMIDALKRHLDGAGIFARKLTVGIAYHSPAMQTITERYKKRLDLIFEDAAIDAGRVNGPVIPMVSSVTGRVVDPQLLRRGQYWADNLVHPVRFCDAAQHVVNLPDTTVAITDMIELGPHSTLRRPLMDSIGSISKSHAQSQPRYHATMSNAESPARTILKLAGQLFCVGHQISIAAANLQLNSDVTPLTDLPKYPFNRSLRYWDESRLSRDSRLPGHAWESPLGVRSNDWNPLQPRWRNVLTLEALPWLKDHVVNGTTVLPGMGSLVMAIQAVRQVASLESKISGFLVKQVDFLRPIIIDDTAGKTETMLHLYPLNSSAEKDTGFFDVDIYAYHDDRWTLCFTCNIKVLVDTQAADEIDSGKEQRLGLDLMSASYQNTAEACTVDVDPRKLYRLTSSIGLHYGASFQLLRDTRWDGQSASTASIGILPSSQYSEQDFFHPTVLDAAIHSTVLQGSNGATQKVPAQVVHRMSNVWISAGPWHTPHVRLASRSRASVNGRSNQSALCIVDADGKPLLSTENIMLTAVTRDNTPERSLMLYNIAWGPTLSLASPDQLQEICGGDQTLSRDGAASVRFFDKIGRAIIASYRQTMRELSAEELGGCPPHIQKYLWSLRRLRTPKYGYVEHDGVDTEGLLKEAELDRPGWKLFTTVARSLRRLITSPEDALGVFFQDRLAEMFYSSMFGEVFDDRMRAFLDTATHARPVRILEVGAGSGSMTSYILSILSDLEKLEGRDRFISYTYTDISPAFFEDARTRFQPFESRMVYTKLDLETDISGAEFHAEPYDIIFAGSVLHATSDLTATLSRLHKLLRPGGRLAFFELVPSFPWIDVVFGLLPGWWLSTEKWRASSPLATEKQWAGLLEQTRFSGADLTFKDNEDEAGHLFTMMISTALHSDPTVVPPLPSPGLLVVVDPSSQAQAILAEQLLRSCGRGKAVTLDEVAGSTVPIPETVISILEVSSSLLPRISADEFCALKQLIQRVSRMVWATSVGVPDEGMDPSGMALGFFRALKTELPEKQIATLVIESDVGGHGALPAASHMASHISQVLQAAFTAPGGEPSASETEFVVRRGCLEVGRMVQAPSLSEDVSALIAPRMRPEEWLPGRPVRLEVGIPGMLDTLRFADDSAFCRTGIADDEVEIEAKAWPISFRDVVIALGRLEGDHDFGLECAGEVTRVGSSCRHLRPGDRVMLATRAMRTYPRGHMDLAFKIPDAWSYADAISMVNPGMTAYHALVNLARLREGERVLIHSASGSTGQMAIHIAKMVGAEIFATAGYKSKKEVLRERFGIPDDHIFYSRNSSFAQGVMRMTGGAGVDVILNSLSGHALHETWECIAPYGRFVEIGKVDIASNTSLPMAPFRANVSFFALDIEHIARTNIQLGRDILQCVMNLIIEGRVDFPWPRHLVPVAEIETAFRKVQSGKHTGRVIVTASRGDVVPKYLLDIPTWSFDANASYVIAGGLGGLGRSIIQWMVRRGARYLILLSRSGIAKAAGMDLISKLEESHVTIMSPKCDIASRVAVEAALESCRSVMPPVRGCINAANVLQDSIFENMTHDQWDLTLRTKAEGTWNLHQLLPQDLDFFILLSSLGGVFGSAAQSNYAAGCAYQDSLARYRVTQGQKAVSLDIGWMHKIGIVAETERYARNLESVGDLARVEEEDLLAILEIYCDPSCPILSPDKSQVLVGVRTDADSPSSGLKPSPQMLRPTFSSFARPRGQHSSSSGSKQAALENDAGALFRHAADSGERRGVVVVALQRKLARLLAVLPDDVDSGRSVHEYGVDSLVGTELRNWIGLEFQAHVAVFELMGGRTLVDLAELVVQRSVLGEGLGSKLLNGVAEVDSKSVDIL